MNSADSVNAEIESHCDGSPMNVWLAQKGLIPTPETEYRYNLITDWHRGGTESYILDFEVVAEGIVTRLIAKACVKPAATDTVREWHKRRARVEAAGIQVPQLFSTRGAVYIEEFIPYTLKEAYVKSDDLGKEGIETKFMETRLKLAESGFNVVSLHDARSRGSDVVLIDFGSDLGGFLTSPNNLSYSEKIAKSELGMLTR